MVLNFIAVFVVKVFFATGERQQRRDRPGSEEEIDRNHPHCLCSTCRFILYLCGRRQRKKPLPEENTDLTSPCWCSQCAKEFGESQSRKPVPEENTDLAFPRCGCRQCAREFVSRTPDTD